MKSGKNHTHKKSDNDLHQKHMSKYTRFASELIFRSHRKNAWLQLFYPILSENIYFMYGFYTENQ